ncbi:MAG: hypothetical protein AB1813_15070 [Verrucomicrobiota bacterium]
MNPDRQQAIHYLRAPAHGIWRWADGGDVLVWHNGQTIAFRQEIVPLLEWLAPNGLPPFGALVFLLAACRGRIPAPAEVLAEETALSPATASSATAAPASAPKMMLRSAVRRQVIAQLESALLQLHKVSALPSELNSGLKAKCVLAEAVFETAKVERHADARIVLRGMREPMDDADLNDPDYIAPGYLRQIHLVAEGLKPHSPESLALRLRTGLDALPAEADVAIPAAERARRLIDELSRDHEYGLVARMARELLAAVRLPRRLGQRELLAVGGMADITNRGALDRLLLSELAHDDLTLAMRVALNEALYLRREPPMSDPPGMLALLLDSGLRQWGLPRVLSVSVALALIVKEKKHSDVKVWRPQGKSVVPVDLLSRAGLIEHLGCLEIAAHPGDALAAFAKNVPPGAQHQSVLITHRDVLGDPSFRRALAENAACPGFVAAVDRDGRFELHALPLARRRPICEADLDLDTILQQAVGAAPLKKTPATSDLPAIFGVAPFPFLLPLAGRMEIWCSDPSGVTYALMHDRRLVQFNEATRAGAKILAVDLPSGKPIWMECVHNRIHIVKAGANHRAPALLSFDLVENEMRVNDLAHGAEILAVCRSADAILVVRSYDVIAYSLADGRMLGRAINPHRWVRGRFFSGVAQFYFVAWDGERVKFEPITTLIPHASILTMFDRAGGEGPWVVLKNGHIRSLATDECISVALPGRRSFQIEGVEVSRDGHQVKLWNSGLEWGRSINLKDGQVQSTGAWPFDQDCGVPPRLPTRNVYRHFDGMAIMPDGLALRGRKHRWRKLGLGSKADLRLQDIPDTEITAPMILPFSQTPRRTAHGCTLQTAQWPSGSKAFLDSRGLLHLKSHLPSVPEISIVLCDGEVAGWTSNYDVCGPSFFFDGARAFDPARVFQYLIDFLRSA